MVLFSVSEQKVALWLTPGAECPPVRTSTSGEESHGCDAPAKSTFKKRPEFIFIFRSKEHKWNSKWIWYINKRSYESSLKFSSRCVAYYALWEERERPSFRRCFNFCEKNRKLETRVAESASSLPRLPSCPESASVEMLTIKRKGTTNVTFDATGIEATSKQTEAAPLLWSTLMCHEGIRPQTIPRRWGGSASGI